MNPVNKKMPKTNRNLKFHPLCEIFPVMEEKELDALTQDIKTNGLRLPILLLDGLIIDGRNRYLACKKAEVKPRFEKFKGDAATLVASLNIHRRHLSESQRAMVAAKLPKIKHGGDRRTDDFQEANLPLEKRAELLGVSERSVKSADKVEREGSSALKAAVTAGEVSVSKAASVVELPKAKQLAAVLDDPSDAYTSDPRERTKKEDTDTAMEFAGYPKEITATFTVKNAQEELEIRTIIARHCCTNMQAKKNGQDKTAKTPTRDLIAQLVDAYKAVTGKRLTVTGADAAQIRSLIKWNGTDSSEEIVRVFREACNGSGFFARQSHQLSTFVKHFGNIRNEVDGRSSMEKGQIKEKIKVRSL